MVAIRMFFRALLALGLLASAASWAQVATVASLNGQAQAIPAAGAPRDLRVGDTLNQGDTVATKANTSAIIRFEDGQVVALTSNSRMAITNYVYNKAEPSKSNVLLSLLDGGMRAVTGLIGKSKPENVTYRAANATIGIRGTDVVFAIFGGNLVISVEGGQVSFRIGNQPPVTINAGNGTFIKADAKTGEPIIVIANSALVEAVGKSSGNLQGVLSALLSAALSSSLNNALTKNLGDAEISSTGLFVPDNTNRRSITGSTSIGGGQNCNQTPKPSGC